MKKSVIITVFVVIVIAAVGGYLGYRHWKATPEYAVSQIGTSIENNDIMLFREYVELDTVLDRGVDDLLSTMPQEGGELSNAFAQGIVKMLKPTIVSELEKGIESWIETGKAPDKSSEEQESESKPGQNVKVGQIGQLEFIGMGKTRREGKVCYSTLNFHNTKYDSEHSAEFLMRETPAGHLKIVEITNLAELIEEMDAAEENWKEEQNEPYREKIDSVIQVVNTRKGAWQDRYGIDEKTVIEVTFSNTSEKTITRIEGDLMASTMTDTPVSKEWEVYSDTAIEAGAEKAMTWQFDANQFIDDEYTIYKTPVEQLEISFQVESLTMEDGDTIALPYPD